MLENKSTTSLAHLGEFGLIEHLTEHIALNQQSTILGVGDDAAVIAPLEGCQMLVSTDILAEGTHFDLAYTPLKHLGYKAIAVNVSDICAMNGTATQVLVSFALSSKFTLEAVEEIYQGMLLAAKKYNVDIVGGDTTSSVSGLFISVTALGFVKPENIAKRSTAKMNDLIVVSGDLGAAFMGLQILLREKAVFLQNPNTQPDLEGMDYLLERQLKPEARQDILQLLEKLAVKPSSMIDISDGLASEILHICKASNVGCKIYEEKLPLDPLMYDTARDFNLDPTTCALNGGEDYELLFTINPEDYDKIKGNPDLTVIGHIVEAEAFCQLITQTGHQIPLQAQGWDALKK
jgi:thiamine-monophosphate kinase